MPLYPGETLNKRYQIVGLLGRGEYGAVYRAWDSRAKAEVAIKEYLDPSVEMQQRFRLEARRLSDLKHPQLPAVRDHFALAGMGQYLITDFVAGVSLQDLLDQYGPLPSDRVIDWLQAVTVPLAYLHEQGHVHLDVKPSNIRLTPAGDIFLVDSGLSGLGIRPGTSGYASPEHQSQTSATPASDIYSLGATLYTLLTNKVPPAGLSRETGLNTLRPAREVNPDVEPYLSLLANRAMSIREDARYESVVDFANALARPPGRGAYHVPSQPRRNQPIHAVAPPPRLLTRQRRQIEQRTILGLAVIFLLIIIAGTAITLSQFQDQLLPGGSEEAATATTESQLIAALTAVAPTLTPPPEPTTPPTATPPPFIAKTGARMIFVPESTFRFGDDEGEPDEQPSRLIRISPYFIDETEVTNEHYAQCVDAGVCNLPDRPNATYHASYYGSPAFNDYPVIFVSWYHASTYCEWRDARLPSEAEWEKAAAFDMLEGVKRPYPWGASFDGLRLNYCDANCSDEDRDPSYDDGHRDTAPVGSFPNGRSAIGLYDMLGNVMEWVQDWYDRDYYADAAEIDPFGPAEGQFKVLRGGSWISGFEDLGTTARTSFDPLVARANIGFRCAMSSN